MKQKTILTALLIFYILSSFLPALAQDDIVKTNLYQSGGVFIGEVWIKDDLIIKLISPKENFLKIKLANTQKRIENAILSGVKSEEIKPYTAKHGAFIKAKNDIILTIYNSELPYYNLSAFDLIKSWTAKLKSAFKKTPQLELSKYKVIVPKDQTKTIWVKNKTISALDVSDYDESIIEVTAYPGKINIKGLRTGQTTILVSCEYITRHIKVIVKEAAGFVPSDIQVKVTGYPAPLSLVKSAVLSDLRDKIITAPGTKTSIDWKGLKKLKALTPGQSCGTQFKVSIKGKYCLPVKGTVKVRVSNVNFTRRGADFIMISNRPEALYAEGEVFSGFIQDYSTHRFLYHHKNSDSGCVRVFTLRLVNNSDQKTIVHITAPKTKPLYREIVAGFLGGHKFLMMWLKNQGQIKEIPPGRSIVVVSERIPPGYVASDLLGFQVLEGSLPKVVANVYNSKKGDYNNYALVQVENEKLIHPKGIFQGPDLNLNYTHTLGGKFVFVHVGAEPFLKEIKTGSPCYGNYGVFYDLNITLENPTYNEKEAEILFVPRSGPAKGVFMLDGVVLETNNTAFSTQKVLLKRYTLSPGEKRKVRLLTFPLSGSHYPVNIVVRSIPEIRK